MPMLLGIEGVEGGEVEATGVRSRTKAIQELRSGAVAITAASDEGAVNVWRLDAGGFRCEFHRFRQIVNSSTYRHIAAVDQWLREWMPKMERQ